jgi:tetratricopeptide (TPR) repeat protein
MKAGFFEKLFNKDKPLGDTAEAFRLLQKGEIDEGRELLRRLCKHEPDNFEANLLGAFELLRRPQDRQASLERKMRVAAIAPKCCEDDALQVVATWTTPSDFTTECFERMSRSTPRCAHGYAIMMLGQLCMSDAAARAALQPGKPLESVTITGVIKATALFMERRQDEALDIYRKGKDRAVKIPDLYEEHLKMDIPAKKRNVIVESYRSLCSIGEALVLRDTGKMDEAREIFARTADEYPNFEKELRALADE